MFDATHSGSVAIDSPEVFGGFIYLLNGHCGMIALSLEYIKFFDDSVQSVLLSPFGGTV